MPVTLTHARRVVTRRVSPAHSMEESQAFTLTLTLAPMKALETTENSHGCSCVLMNQGDKTHDPSWTASPWREPHTMA